MKQSSLGLGTSTKRTRRREFLDEMEQVVPWSDLVAQIQATAERNIRRFGLVDESGAGTDDGAGAWVESGAST